MHQASTECTRALGSAAVVRSDNNVWHVKALNAQQIYATSCEQELHFLAV
jgi:hypothetical protein